MNKVKFKDRMGKITEEHLDSLVDTGQDDSKALDRIYASFKQDALSKPKKTKGRLNRWTKRMGIAAALAAVIFMSSVILSGNPTVHAIRTNLENFFIRITNPEYLVTEDGNIIKDFTSFEELEKELGYLPLQVAWTPPGYELNSIQLITARNDAHIISYSYHNAEKQPLGYIEVNMAPYLLENANTAESGFYSTQNFRTTVINDMEVAISDSAPYTAYFTYRDTHEVMVTTDADRDDLEQFIAGMQIH